VAESPFAAFDEVAFDRLSQEVGMPRPAFWPIVRLGFVWARLRYGVDLRQASPMAAVRTTHIPVLLIHGDRDVNIPIRHSRELQAANRSMVELWEIQGAGHVECLSQAPKEYPARVLRWFREH